MFYAKGDEMQLETEINEKLKRLLKVQEAHSHKPQTCPTCGQQTPIYDSWILSDYSYIDGEISALKWVLSLTENLTEDHT